MEKERSDQDTLNKELPDVRFCKVCEANSLFVFSKDHDVRVCCMCLGDKYDPYAF